MITNTLPQLPTDVVNIIINFASQLQNKKWTPLFNPRDNNLFWRVNKWSNYYNSLHNVSKNRKINTKLLNIM